MNNTNNTTLNICMKLTPRFWSKSFASLIPGPLSSFPIS